MSPRLDQARRCLLMLCLCLLAACQHSPHQSCLALIEASNTLQPSLQLNQYRVIIDRKALPEIANLSGLTWNYDTKTLFAVTNKEGEILEISTQGELLRVIKTSGIRDAEAIEYIGHNKFIIADERFQKLLKITLDDKTLTVNAHLVPQLIVSQLAHYNKGLEGLAYNDDQHIIYTANESQPISIFQVSQSFSNNQTPHISPYLSAAHPLFIKDISGLHYYLPYHHLLVLSDESKSLIELDNHAQPIGCMPLISNYQGLTNSIKQPEGITMDDEDNLYIVSEPNFFYKFEKANLSTQSKSSKKTLK